MLLGCDWWFSIRFYFVAEKSLTMTRTCTVVNFHNFHGQFGGLVFEQTESSDKCWFVVKWLFQRDPKGKLNIPRRRKDQLVVSNQVVTYPYYGLSVIFCGFISHLIGRETINIPEIFSGVHGFMGKTVKCFYATCVFLRGNLRVRLATERKSLRKLNLRSLATTCRSFSSIDEELDGVASRRLTSQSR